MAGASEAADAGGFVTRPARPSTPARELRLELRDAPLRCGSRARLGLACLVQHRQEDTLARETERNRRSFAAPTTK